ncbi:hypothetical protein Sjap_005807 [Stephania japonica]|uniref:Uncharacterized protein n=1 Tax=Stephania japonica TaxID=461633 RepID=A0AAP0K693_9MAGN
MAPAEFINNATKPNHQTTTSQIDRETRDLVSALTHRLNELHHIGKLPGHHQDGDDGHDHNHHHHHHEEEQGARIITLAGTNTGATMHGEYLDDIPETKYGFSQDVQEAMTTYANSNFQAVNNSIMFNSHYTCDDPGVHIETTEMFERPESKTGSHGKKDREKNKEKKKNKGKGSSKSDSESSSEESSDEGHHGKE